MTRLLGVHIAHGCSSEARVFAGLLAHRDGDVDAHVLCHNWRGDTQTAARFAETGAAVHPMDFGWRSAAPGRPVAQKVGPRLHLLASLRAALTQAREINPDVVYSNQQVWDCLAATRIARALGKPHIVHLHYIVGPWLRRAPLRRLRTCARVLAVSDYIRGEALRHGVLPERVETLRNTVNVPPADPALRDDVRRELGIALDAPLLGIVARLDPDKGQADTLRALAHIAPAFPAARLLLVGSPTPWHPGCEAKLRALAQSLGVSGRVLFLGQRGDVPRLLAALDIFVHPSRRDPCPLALLEASAAGLPVVAYAEGGALEIVQDEMTGLLASPGDEDELAACLAALLRDPVGAAHMGVAGRERMAREFRPEDAGRAFSHAVRQMAAAPSEPAGARAQEVFL